MTTKPREIEINGHKVEFVGPSRQIALFIDGVWPGVYFKSIRSARAYAKWRCNQ